MKSEQIAKNFDPHDIEHRIYDDWTQKGYFTPQVDVDKEPFCIVIPPPNITGQLHMGHALDVTMQDIITRMKRMQGFAALWLPGTDHASIATEVKISEKLASEGLDKKELGREEFLKRAWEWKEEYGGRIVEQLKKLGGSLDWSRERFTLDEGCNEAVIEAFITLYKKGLIYRGERTINWCPECKTALSDAEVEHEAMQGSLWKIKYKVKGSDETVIVATTRPETMLGDTAVAINPDDSRYSHLSGATLLLPLMNREIPIVEDHSVDLEFGTGAVKVTPAHDHNDFETGLRHDLPRICVMNLDATMSVDAGRYAGLDRYEARKAVVSDLESLSLLEGIDKHDHSVGTCYRCHTVIEPIISKQWFVKMKPLAIPAIEVVKTKEIEFIPERFEKIYFNWMENIKDWCISRQLWWGHRIPAYYCCGCSEIVVAHEKPDICKICGSTKFRQDEDVLDTWFSSALWPFSTLGWPNKTEDLKYFYPTSVLVTGYDIIFFWVARMIFSGLAYTGEIPFKQVLIHGIIRDSDGKKMSKSLGNGIDPLDVIEKYGADALRLSLIMGNSPGNDMRFYWDKVESSRNFANKVWNAFRFIMMNTEDGNVSEPEISDFGVADKWIIGRYSQTVSEVTGSIEKYDLGLAAQKLYDFIWNEFCDWYIEFSKPMLYGSNVTGKKAALFTLHYVLSGVVRLLHPYMPFITSEIWKYLPGNLNDIMVSKWPSTENVVFDQNSQISMQLYIDIIKSVRNIRTDMQVQPGKKSTIILVSDESLHDILSDGKIYFEKLAYASKIYIRQDKSDISPTAVSAVIDKVQIFMPLEDLKDTKKELERLTNEKEHLSKELLRAKAKLENESFMKKAPAAVVDEEKAKETRYKEMLDKIAEQIEILSKMS